MDKQAESFNTPGSPAPWAALAPCDSGRNCLTDSPGICYFHPTCQPSAPHCHIREHGMFPLQDWRPTHRMPRRAPFPSTADGETDAENMASRPNLLALKRPQDLFFLELKFITGAKDSGGQGAKKKNKTSKGSLDIKKTSCKTMF